MDGITQVQKRSYLTQCLPWATADMSQSWGHSLHVNLGCTSVIHLWKLLRRLCQAFSLVATKMHAATRIHFRPQVSKVTLKEYIQRFSDLIIQAMGTHLTAVPCQVTIVLFIRHLFNKEIKRRWLELRPFKIEKDSDPGPGSWNQSKKYEGFNDYNPPFMQVSTIPQTYPVVMTIQVQCTQVGNQNTNRNVSKLD